MSDYPRCEAVESLQYGARVAATNELVHALRLWMRHRANPRQARYKGPTRYLDSRSGSILSPNYFFCFLIFRCLRDIGAAQSRVLRSLFDLPPPLSKTPLY
jgi:hypothetical protein